MRIYFVCTILVFSFLSIGCGYSLKKSPTSAMLPTIQVDANLLVNENFYIANKNIERFDIVIHTRPINENDNQFKLDENSRFIFRVIAVGGEKVELKKGRVFINDQELVETFEKLGSDDNFGPIIIPENQFFLLGDNRSGSEDSRFWKPSTIKRGDIFGKVVKIF
jgi:signal peptidase I